MIIGAKRIDQLQDNIAAVPLKLSADEMKELDVVSALPPEYPGWMLPFQNMSRLEPVSLAQRADRQVEEVRANSATK